MSKDAADMQIEQLKSQVNELRSKMDEFLTGPQMSEKARQTMEQARQTALGMGQRLAERKDVAVPIGTVLFSLLALFTVFMFYPDFGTKTTHWLRHWWNEYFGNVEEY